MSIEIRPAQVQQQIQAKRGHTSAMKEKLAKMNDYDRRNAWIP